MAAHTPFRQRVALVVGVLVCAVRPPPLDAQGVTTAAIVGHVVVDGGVSADGARVRVTNRATGYTVETTVRNGRFAVSGLEVGGPYDVTVRHLGYRPYARDGLSLSLGARRELDIELAPVTRLLDTVRTTVSAVARVAHSPTGAGMMISEATLRRLPTRDRELYDFARLVPQVTTRFGISGGGVNHRFNSFLLDGVSERALQGALPAGGAAGGKSISQDAVREYQVLLSPYEVRYGNFTGALVNAVSKSGTNVFHGTVYAFARNDRMARATEFLRGVPYERVQYGLTLGGPIVRDRVHFFLAPEFQFLTAPAQGPHLEQSQADQAPTTVADVARFTDLLRQHGLAAGSAGQVDVRTPLRNAFARVDVLVPEWRSRFVLRQNYSWARADRFTRNLPGDVFPLSSYGWTQQVTKATTAAQMMTHFGHGGLNELRVAYTVAPLQTMPVVRQPVVVVRVPTANAARSTSLQAGTNELAQVPEVAQTNVEAGDDISFPLGPKHTIALGARVDLFHLQVRGGVAGGYGRWEFSSLDSLEGGLAARYSLAKDLGGADTPLRGASVAWYAGDDWRPSDRLRLTYGVRADLLSLRGHPEYNSYVAETYGRRTDVVPPARVYWSPRLGAHWDVGGERSATVRAGAGVFTGPPPLAWIHSAFREYGVGVASLSCGTNRTDRGAVPPFVADYRSQPTACADGEGFVDPPRGAVTLLDMRSALVQVARTSLAYERAMPGGVQAAVEGMYTRNVSDFLFVNGRLRGPVGVDHVGRVLYGTLGASGVAQPSVVGDESQNTDVVRLRKQSNNYAYQLLARAEKRFGERVEITGAYAFSRVRDVQSSTSAFPSSANWREGRVMSGRHESIATGISAFDVPHRVILTAFYTSPWRRWATDVSLSYIGESGNPFTYVAFGALGRGDLNADGSNTNDPIYVPRDAFDDREIRFSGLSSAAGADNSPQAQARRVTEQQRGYESLVENNACLRAHQGTIMRRNSCRAPGVHTSNVAIQQSLPLRGRRLLVLHLEVFNLLNLLHPHWGRFRTPNATVLEHVGQVAGETSSSESLFRFDPERPRFDSRNIESAYQFQLALRYGF